MWGLVDWDSTILRLNQTVLVQGKKKHQQKSYFWARLVKDIQAKLISTDAQTFNDIFKLDFTSVTFALAISG